MKQILFIFLFILAFSCENSPKDEAVLTGITNENMYFEDINPDISPEISWNCGNGYGSATIDLYNDGLVDIYLTANFLDLPIFDSCYCYPPLDCSYSAIFWIYSNSDVEIASYYEFWGSDVPSWSHADTLNLDYRIDTISRWESRTELWRYDTPVSHGGWFQITKDMYLGIRKGDSTNYKYGWILVGPIQDNNPIFWDNNFTFKEYAIEK